MDFVAFLSFKPSLSTAERDGGLARRAVWQYPKGIHLIAEYWPASGAVQVVSIFSADDYEPIMELELEWNDVFDIDVSPAVSAEDGLKMGAEVFGRLARLQPS
jgi:hypothetical protein